MESFPIDFNTGNCVVDFVLNCMVLIQLICIWCAEKILTSPILTALALIVILIICAINTMIKIEIRGNLWKWRNK